MTKSELVSHPQKQNLQGSALWGYNSRLRSPVAHPHWQGFGVFRRSTPRWLMMSILMWPLAVWGVVTAVLVILLIYRSTLTMQEDDQLFLGESESHMEKEQIEIMAKVNKITPLVKWVGAASGVLLLVIAGLAVYQGLQNAAQ